MTIFIDANETLTTWKLISEAGDFRPYRNRATQDDVVLRWGCNGVVHNFNPEGVRVLNRRIILDKKEQWERMSGAEVPMPRVFLTREKWEEGGSPSLISKPRVGQMGTGIRRVLYPNWRRADVIYQEYIDKTREFRAMMVGGLMAFFMEKHAPTNGDFRWNEHRGSTWSNVPEDARLRRYVKRIGKRALEALEYDFGAMDIIMDDHNRLLVLEVNSRPEFGRVNAERFVRSIQSYLTN